MSAGSRNNKNSPGHSPVTYRKMVGIFCFLLKIHPRRHGSAQRVPTDVPVCDFGKAFRDAVRRVPIQYGQIAGHLYQHAQNAVLGKVVQEGSIGGVFHLAARIEDQPGGGRFRRKDPVAVLLGDAHHVIRYQRILGGGVGVVVIVDVNAECNADGQQNGQQPEKNSAGKRFFLLVHIPNFPVSTVAGHKGALLAGKLGDTEVYAMEGRFHFYEGYSMKEVCYPFYVFKLLDVEKVVLTNACGGINREFAPGTLMLLTDFINMMGTNPLIGPNDERFGPRFPDMTEPYSLELRNLAKQTADELGIAYKEGVYMGFMGPCYETAAEIRAFAGVGADAVGMSTVPETMVCNYLGMKVLAVSCITNMATGIQTVKHSHARVLEIANRAGETLCRWLGSVIQKMEG